MVTYEPIKVDLDDVGEAEIAGAWRQLEMVGDVYGRVSSSGKGVHLQAHDTGFSGLSELGYTVRAEVGDDPLRIIIDKQLSKGSANILFDEKLDSEAGPWRPELDDLLIDLYYYGDRA